jgi:phage-related protein
MTKPVEFHGSALEDLRAFPKAARQSAGYQIDRVQRSEEPHDWKPLKTIGPGVREIRIREDGGAFRIVYLAVLQDAVHVLHCFEKKSGKISRADVSLGPKRYRELMKEIGK